MSHTVTSRELVRQVPTQNRLFSRFNLYGLPPLTPHFERNDISMNRNPKEKLARIEIRVKPKEKDKIKQLAEKCNLSISEYIAQRALGYEPITLLPDVFFDFYNKLCQLDNTAGFTPETENKLLSLIDEIHSELLLPRKEAMRKWRPPDSGLSKTG